MKKIIFSIILCLGLISSTFKTETITLGNKSIALLAGSPFYIASLYLYNKMHNYKSGSMGDGTPLLYAGGSVISLLAGGLTSSLTYIYLNSKK